MDERSSRIFIGMCLLVLVWIGFYWMWEPSPDQKPPEISFAQPEEQRPQAPDPDRPATRTPTPPRQNPDPFSPSKEAVPGNTPDPKPSQPGLVAPEFIEHIVQPSETMQSIASRYLGSRDKWSVIARANPFVDPEKLKPGQSIRIPKDPDNIQGRITGRTTPDGVVESHTYPEPRVIEYVIRPGDSLSRIAQRIYGSARHARFIYENNREILKSMDDISVGQLLKLPPLPQTDGDTP